MSVAETSREGSLGEEVGHPSDASTVLFPSNRPRDIAKGLKRLPRWE